MAAGKIQVWEKQYTSAAIRNKARIYAVQWDKKHIIFSDGVSGVYVWDGTLTAPVLIKDKVPYLPNNYGSSTSSLPLASCPNIPAGHFLCMHRNRLFYVEPLTSKVYYSGTRTDLSDSESTPQPIKPWELWNTRMDLSRYNPGYGGSMIIGNPKETIIGITPTENGMLVFKERSIHLWNWPDSAAPHEVTQGASVSKIADGIGAVSYDAIDIVGDNIVFLSRDAFGKYAIFMLSPSGGLQDISPQLGSTINKVSLAAGIMPNVKVVGHFIVVAYDNGDTELSIRHMYDIQRNAWIDMTSPRIVCMEPSQQTETLLVGTDAGVMLAYPSLQHEDLDLDSPTVSAPIPFLARGRYVDVMNPPVEKKFRKAWVTLNVNADTSVNLTLRFDDEVGKLPNKEPHNVSGEPTYQWYFDYDEEIAVLEGLQEIEMNTAHRGHNLQVEVSGTTSAELSISSFQAGWRERTEK